MLPLSSLSFSCCHCCTCYLTESTRRSVWVERGQGRRGLTDLWWGGPREAEREWWPEQSRDALGEAGRHPLLPDSAPSCLFYRKDSFSECETCTKGPSSKLGGRSRPQPQSPAKHLPLPKKAWPSHPRTSTYKHWVLSGQVPLADANAPRSRMANICWADPA